MKKAIFTLLTAGTLFAVANSAVFAANTSNEAVSMSTVLKNLRASGYVIAKDVQFGQGEYKAKVMDAVGNSYSLAINPQTGDVEDTKIVRMKVSMNEAVDDVINAGYNNIYSIEMDNNKYVVKAFNKDNKKVKLAVDGISGDVSVK